MTRIVEESPRLLDVSYFHKFKGRDGKSTKMYTMHPTRNVSGEGSGSFSIRNRSSTKLQAYVSELEMAELFAINGFKELGINLRMLPVGGYENGSPPPGLKPSRADIVPGSQFDLVVKDCGAAIERQGLSNSLYLKLGRIKVAIPKRLIPHTTVVTRPTVEQVEEQPIFNPGTVSFGGTAPDEGVTFQGSLGAGSALPSTPRLPERDHASQEESEREERINGLQIDVDAMANQIDAEYANRPGGDVDAVVKRRVGQGPFRDLLELKCGVACCLSGVSNRRLLIASHIVPWSRSTAAQKTDHENGLLLAVGWDALFDKGFVSFDDEGRLLRSEQLDEDTIQRLGMSIEVSLPDTMLTPRRKANLAQHRRQHRFELEVS